MKKRKTNLFCLSLLLALLVSAGCTPRLVSLPDPTQAQVDLNATADVLRTQVASTVESSITATSAALPTQAPPTEAPSPTQTFAALETLPPLETTVSTLPSALPSITPVPSIVYIPTSTSPAAVYYPTSTPVQTNYQCLVVSQSISWGMKIRAGVDFDSVWTITNSGKKDWDAGDVTYEYVTGAEVQTKDAYTLNKGVDTDDKVDIIVDMIAPKEPGIYQTSWAVYHGNTAMCTLNLTFRSVEP